MEKRVHTARVAKAGGLSTRFLTCTALAQELGVAPNTVRHWCREGWLRAHAELTPGGHYRIPRCVLEALRTGEFAPPPEGTTEGTFATQKK